jgi:RNA polymerase sigma-70 factor (ECF subfamily)
MTASHEPEFGKPSDPLVGVSSAVAAEALAVGNEGTAAVERVRPAAEAFDRFYAREFPQMVNIAYAVSGSRMAAEDLAQEAMVAAYRRWDEVQLLDRPGAWVRRVVLNRAASAYHRRRAEARALLRLAPLRGAPPAPMGEGAAEFWVAVRSLPHRQAQAVALHYLEDSPISEIAAVMGCAESTVKVHLHRGRQALAAHLALRSRDDA